MQMDHSTSRNKNYVKQIKKTKSDFVFGTRYEKDCVAKMIH